MKLGAGRVRIVLATRNRDKVGEIRRLLDPSRFEVIPVHEVADVPEVEEDGRTLAENALKKARTAARVTGLPAMADDTGLEVDALGGRPGVFSSRFAGEGASYEDNVRKLLAELKGVPQERRTARFRCVVAIVDNSTEVTVEGVCEGLITEKPRGSGGFGYDPVFLVPEKGRTFAEMTTEEKNRISHRGQAFRKAARELEKLFGVMSSTGA